MRKVLTIIVPTYNRADCVALLLGTLEQQLAGLEDRVNVIVGDNASTDSTPDITAAFSGRYRAAQVLRHQQNVGPDENFCLCLDRVTTRFFWIIGDDDLPKSGVVGRIVRLLDECDPDLLQLGSEWLPKLAGANDGSPVGGLNPVKISSEDFAAGVNVWVTFISGMIVNRERLLELDRGLNIRRFTGTNLVQLGWVLPLMMNGRRLFIARERCILATSGNTGGYKLITVFATNFPAIVEAVCGTGTPQQRGILRMLAWNYVPSLLWLTRFGNAGAFAGEDVRQSLAPLRSTLAFPLVLWPVLTLPKPLARPFWILSRLLGPAIRFFLTCKRAFGAARPAGYAR